MLSCVGVKLSVFVKARNPRVLYLQSSKYEVDIQQWKPLSFSKIIKGT